MIAFDKSAQGEGVSADCHMENGKVILEWQTVLTQIDFRGTLRLRLFDQCENLVLECMQASDEEEPLVSVLLQPHFWTGPENPYLYRLEAILEDRQGNEMDRVERLFSLRCVELRRMPGEAAERLFLNGECYVPRAVAYELSEQSGELYAETEQAHRSGQELQGESHIIADLKRIVALGANCICLNKTSQLPTEAVEFCERNGLLTVVHTSGKISVGGKPFTVDNDRSLEDYLGKIPAFPGLDEILYRARWGKVPFVHICAGSLQPTKSGNFTVTCYSNCKRLALYSDGKLFEFQHGREVFTFQEIPVKGPCIMLAVEGEGCSASLSVHKTFTKLSPIGDK